MSNKDDDINNDLSDTSVLVKKRTKLKKPPLYKVLLLNDDFTPMGVCCACIRKILFYWT